MNEIKPLGKVFGSAWKTAKNNFATLFLATIIYVGIILFFSAADIMVSISAMGNADYGVSAGASAMSAWFSLGSFVAALFLTPLYLGFITAVMRAYHMTGAKTPFHAAWRAACTNYSKYLLTLLVQWLFLILFVAILAVIAIIIFICSGVNFWSYAFSGTQPDVLQFVAIILTAMVPVLVICSIIACFYQFCQLFTSYIPGMENKRAFQAFFDSFRYIFKGNFWKNLGNVLLIGLIEGGILTAVICPMILAPLTNQFNLMLLGMTGAASQSLFLLNGMLPIMIVVLLVVSSLLTVFVQPYCFEVYLNAKAAYDAKHGRQTAPQYYRPQTPGNGQPPMQG